jgi:hypothetical protein
VRDDWIAIATGNMNDGMPLADVGRQGNDHDKRMTVECATHWEATIRSTPQNFEQFNAKRKRKRHKGVHAGTT